MQNQIYFLCDQVQKDEWSGTLFYTVEGDLGDDNFTVNAEELYLQDIGNSTYTEYDPSNPEFIKFLMENPRFMEMKQGHIHSHNTMSVFFSGTDEGELVDNAPFHNFYVSLIVNNANEMCAKVAFCATEKKETKSTVSFRAADGSLKNKEVAGTTEEKAVYAYDCSVFIPDTVGESFETRFLQVKTSCDERDKELAKKAKAITKGLGTQEKSTTEKAYGGWSGDKEWSQVGLFEDVRGEDKVVGRGKKEKKSRNWRDERPFVEWSGSVDGAGDPKIATPSIGVRVDPNVYSFLVKLLSRDFTSEDRLSVILRKLNNDFYSSEYKHVEGADILYMDSIDQISVSHYINVFQEDFHVKNLNKTLRACIDILDTYSDVYPELIANLTEALNMAMDD